MESSQQLSLSSLTATSKEKIECYTGTAEETNKQLQQFAISLLKMTGDVQFPTGEEVEQLQDQFTETSQNQLARVSELDVRFISELKKISESVGTDQQSLTSSDITRMQYVS